MRMAATDRVSVMQIRLSATHTRDDAQWAKTLAALRANRGACDEVWFSTGVTFPPLAWHVEHARRLSRYAGQLRKVGIVPSLQIQATVGHGDDVAKRPGADFSGKAWGGFTGRGGIECRFCNCPRQPAFIDYMRGIARAYAAFRPRSVWIDDDLKVFGASPAQDWSPGNVGCWCDDCVAAFNAATGGNWTRQSLDAAMGTEGPLFEQWERFCYVGIAAAARAIAEEIHAISPETRLGWQHGRQRDDKQRAVLEAMHEASGHFVGSRPGGGNKYYDYNPNELMFKAFNAIAVRRSLGNPEWIDEWVAEVETWPRVFASRTAQGLLIESFASLAVGMNGISLFCMNPDRETDEWAAKTLLKPMSDERPFFDAYVRQTAGAVPVGFADRTSIDSVELLYNFALAGVPVLPGSGLECGEVSDADLFGSISMMSSGDIMRVRRTMDERSGGRSPVVVETPSACLVLPHSLPDRTLRTVAIVNARIDWQEPMLLRLRGVPRGVDRAAWHVLRGKTADVALVRDGGDALADSLGEFTLYEGFQVLLEFLRQYQGQVGAFLCAEALGYGRNDFLQVGFVGQGALHGLHGLGHN